MTSVHSSLRWHCSLCPVPRVNSHPKARDGVGLSPPVPVLIPAPITCEGNSLLPAQPILEWFLSAFLLSSSFS